MKKTSLVSLISLLCPGSIAVRKLAAREETPMRSFKLIAPAVFILAMAMPLHATTFEPCSSVAGNLVTNCGFETGDTTGWTTGGSYAATAVVPSGLFYSSDSGNYILLMGAVGSDSTLSQTLSTTAGGSYTFAFYYASDGTDPSDFSAYWDGTELLSLTDPNSGSLYDLYAFTVTGTGSDALQFDFRDDLEFDALDDISVSPSTSPVPEPASFSLLLMGLGAAFVTRRLRRA